MTAYREFYVNLVQFFSLSSDMWIICLSLRPKKQLLQLSLRIRTYPDSSYSPTPKFFIKFSVTENVVDMYNIKLLGRHFVCRFERTEIDGAWG